MRLVMEDVRVPSSTERRSTFGSSRPPARRSNCCQLQMPIAVKNKLSTLSEKLDPGLLLKFGPDDCEPLLTKLLESLSNVALLNAAAFRHGYQMAAPVL
jgi:hypothetical protein